MSDQRKMSASFSFRLQLIVFALVSSSFTNIYITQPVLPVLQQEFAVDTVLVSFTVSAVILGIAIANLPFGLLADRIAIQPIIAVGGLGGRLLGGWIHPPLHWRYAFVSASVLILITTVSALQWPPRARAQAGEFCRITQTVGFRPHLLLCRGMLCHLFFCFQLSATRGGVR